MPKQLARYAPVIVVAALVIIGVYWAATHQPPPKKFVHEHAAFAWYADGQELSFRSLDYDFASGFQDVVHMHAQGAEGDASDVLHIEGSYVGGNPDWTVKRIFEQYGMKITPGDITFDSKDGHHGQRFADQGNATWHFLVSKVTGTTRGPFVNISTLAGADYTSYVPREQDKILMTYGDLTQAQLAQQEASIPDANEWRAAA
ncbi:MAG: hypothetical protein LC624_08600 [Halobacteriales archaeon]|nr:hypothetical protein [Halobacteriales archaeon]